MKISKICGILLLAGAMALAGCNGALDDPDQQQTASTGQVKLLINGEDPSSRTLMPTLPTLTYEVVCTKGTNSEKKGPFNANADKTFSLEPGNWTIEVKALDTSDVLIASYTTTTTVTSNQTSTESITLKPISAQNGGAEGIFEYKVDFNTIASTHNVKGYITLTPDSTYFTGNNANNSVIVLEKNNVNADVATSIVQNYPNGKYEGEVKLPAGVYKLDVRLVTGVKSLADDHTQSPPSNNAINDINVDIHKTEVVYIYSGLKTSMDMDKYTFKNEDIAKLCFAGKVTIHQQSARTSYSLKEIEVYLGNNATALKVYKDIDSPTASTVTTVTTGSTTWSLYIPSYEIDHNASSESLRFRFKLTTSGRADLYVSKSGVNFDLHGNLDVDIEPTIILATGTVAGGIVSNWEVYSYDYSSPTGFGTLLPNNNAIIAGQPIQVKLTSPTPTTLGYGFGGLKASRPSGDRIYGNNNDVNHSYSYDTINSPYYRTYTIFATDSDITSLTPYFFY